MAWPIAALIGAGAVLGGGVMSSMENREDRLARQAQDDKNIALQKEFAQYGVRWKVADAKAAGVNPLAAMGASTHTYRPVQAGSIGGRDTWSRTGQSLLS